MNNDLKPQDPCYLVRRGGHVSDPHLEDEVYLPTGKGWVAKLLSFLPGGRKKYIVPKFRLPSPITLDGAALDVTIDETGEDITLFPKLSIVAVVNSEEARERLAAALDSSYDTQLVKIRQIIGGIFADKVGLSCESKRLDQLADPESSLSKEVCEDVDQRLGLKINWLLKPDAETEQWIRALQAELSKAVTQSFNQESRTSQFNLRFSIRILSVAPSKFHVVHRRARAGLTPSDEKDEILGIIYNALNPGFGIFGGGRRISDHPAFWPLVEAAFQQVAAPRIAEEFGYEMSFTDHRRERTEAEIDTLKKLENADMLKRSFDKADQDLEGAEDHLLELRDQERIAIKEDDLDADSDRLLRIRKNIKQGEKDIKAATKRRQNAQVEMENLSQGATIEFSTEDSGQAKHFLQQFSDLLRLEVKDLPKLLGESEQERGSAQSDHSDDSKK